MSVYSKWLWVDGDYLLTYLWFRGAEVVQQFWLQLAALVVEFGSDRVAVAWDSDKNRRRQLWDPYKRNRLVPPEWRQEKPQLRQRLRESLVYLPLVQGEVPGLEADDLLWCWQQRRYGLLVSGDHDLWQCLDREGIAAWSPRHNKCTTQREVDKQFGGVIAMVIQKCLVGDKSDGVPGVVGVGEVRAKELWAKFAADLIFLVRDRSPVGMDTEDRWMQQVIADKAVLQRNWQLLRLGELVNTADLEAAENLLQQPIKLFDVAAARNYAATQGWFNVLKEWHHLVKAFQPIS